MKKMPVKPVNFLITLFLRVGIIAVLTAYVFVPDKSFSETEKRVLNLFPDFSFSDIAF